MAGIEQNPITNSLQQRLEKYWESHIDPKRPLDLPVPVVNALTVFPKLAESIFPGLKTGKYIPDDPEIYAGRMVPNEQVRRGLLLANCESLEGLKQGVRIRLEVLSKNFGIRKFGDFVNPIESTGIDDRGYNIFQALKVVEHALESKSRKTGEPDIAHIYRMLLNGIDLIYANTRIYNNGGKVIPFTAESAEFLLLEIILHDFIETSKADDQRLGRVVPRQAETSRGKMSVLVQEIDQNDPNKVNYEEEISVHIQNYPYLIEGLTALDRAALEDVDQFQRLVKIPKEAQQEFPLFYYRHRLFHSLPRIVKILDLLDNLRTRTFVFQDDQYLPADRNKLIEKCNKILQFAPLIERDLLGFMSRVGVVRPWFLDNLTTNSLYILGLEQKEALLHTDILRLLPTRWTILTLLGLGPNEIYGHNAWQVKGPWIPESL